MPSWQTPFQAKPYCVLRSFAVAGGRGRRRRLSRKRQNMFSYARECNLILLLLSRELSANFVAAVLCHPNCTQHNCERQCRTGRANYNADPSKKSNKRFSGLGFSLEPILVPSPPPLCFPFARAHAMRLNMKHACLFMCVHRHTGEHVIFVSWLRLWLFCVQVEEGECKINNLQNMYIAKYRQFD